VLSQCNNNIIVFGPRYNCNCSRYRVRAKILGKRVK
jgi:hypothetical protein